MRTPLLMIAVGVALAAGATTVTAAADAVPAGPIVATPISEPIVVGTDGNGQSQSLKVGQELAVALPDNPSTGFVWQVRELDQAVLHQEGEPQFRSNSIVPGADGMSVWTFTAVAPGSTHLTLASVRPWEQGSAPAQQFSLSVTVH
ncbi:protease inhibitor I42 family protein [Nocardia transvalensis]|uniref:protease inhibitor I42 family protein n=1 Tax=Nocardia transvalensis TaxID=37333 RepID=UPI00189348EB|nr:protease inhibitor I42 family protein [Nocardia transvalensis]MBF6332489.1 protease inhibitor I42 family protein [Nocardia transvalensis]